MSEQVMNWHCLEHSIGLFEAQIFQSNDKQILHSFSEATSQ